MTEFHDTPLKGIENQFDTVADEEDRKEKESLLEEYKKNSELCRKFGDSVEEWRVVSRQRDELLRGVIRPFLPSLREDSNPGRIHDKTGWDLYAVEPIPPEDFRSADAIVVKKGAGSIGMIVCLPHEYPRIPYNMNQDVSPSKIIDQALEHIRQNTARLSKEIGINISPGSLIGIICIPEDCSEEVLTNIKGNVSKKNTSPSVWEVQLEDGNSIKIVTSEVIAQLNGSINPIEDELTREFENPIQISEDLSPVPSFFVHSHILRKTAQAVRHVVSIRKQKDEIAREFTDQEIYELFESQDKVARNKNSSPDKVHAEELLSWWEKTELAKSRTADESNINISGASKPYKFNIPVENPNKVISEVQSLAKIKLRNQYLEAKAMREVLDQ